MNTNDIPPRSAPAIEPLLLDAAQAAALVGVSVRTWWSWSSAGQVPLPILRRGRIVRWQLRGPHGLLAWIEAGCPPRDRWQASKAGRP